MNFATLTPQRPADPHPLFIIERFLRDRPSVWQQINAETHLNGLIRDMLISSATTLSAYGLVMGSFQGVLQALSSAVKLPILFLLTLLICLPTLYLFNLLCGGRLSARQVLALVLAAITVISTLTVAFAPITLFFRITAPDYLFFILLNVAILTLTASIGLWFLIGGMHAMNVMRQAQAELDQPAAPRLPGINMALLQVWMLLFGFVGTQLAWTLRPFYGDPSQPFIVFRAIEGNFYMSVIQTFFGLFGR